MVALDPRFALLAVQCMVLLAALPSPVTAVVVRSPHSNGPGHSRQRDPLIPAPNGAKKYSSTKHHALSSASAKKHEKRDVRFRFLINDNSLITNKDNHAIDVNLSSAGLQAKKTRDFKVLQARDPPTLDKLQGLLASLLDAVQSLLTGLVRRHHDREDHCHDCDNTYEYINDPSHVHEHNHEVTVNNRDSYMRERRDMDSDLVPGTALVTVSINSVSS